MPTTAIPPETVIVVPLIVVGSIASLNVMVMFVFRATPVAPLIGDVADTVGAVVSGIVVKVEVDCATPVAPDQPYEIELLLDEESAGIAELEELSGKSIRLQVEYGVPKALVRRLVELQRKALPAAVDGGIGPQVFERVAQISAVKGPGFALEEVVHV